MGLIQNNSEDNFDCDKYVCSECVKDDYLSKLIEKNKTNKLCSYCFQNGASRMQVFLENVNLATLNYYADAQDLCIPTNNSDFPIEGEHIRDILYQFDPGWSDALVDDAAYFLDQDKCWIPHAKGSWGLMNPAEFMEGGWRNFVKTVQTKTRYFFDSEPVDENYLGHPDYLPVSYVLSELDRVTRKSGLIKKIKAGSDFYRVQPSKSNEKFDFIRLSVPPHEKATAGRMNPEGIPYLYLSSELETAQNEALKDLKSLHHALHIKNKEPLFVLDLSNLPQKPSIFDFEKYDELHELYFLESFSKEISKPILKNENIEYIPTQIVSEYFRHRFKHENISINGILFNSSKSDGKNFALFYSDHKKVIENFTEISIQKY